MATLKSEVFYMIGYLWRHWNNIHSLGITVDQSIFNVSVTSLNNMDVHCTDCFCDESSMYVCVFV